jgi:hypothetical protein
MARVYTVSFENVAVTAAQDFFEVTPADDHPLVILALYIDQFSDVGDAAEEILRYKIIRGHTTSGSGGSAATPRPLDPGDAAASFAAEVNNTTIASSGATVDLHAGAFNIRSGLALIFPPEMTPVANQGNTTIVVRLMANPADSLSMSGTLYVAEL